MTNCHRPGNPTTTWCGGFTRPDFYIPRRGDKASRSGQRIESSAVGTHNRAVRLTLSDTVIRIAYPEVAAAKLGLPLADVLERREALGLPNLGQARTPRVARERRSSNQHKAWSADEIALLSEFGPKEVAKRTGRSLAESAQTRASNPLERLPRQDCSGSADG